LSVARNVSLELSSG